MMHKNKKILFSLFAVLIVSLLAYLVWAADTDPDVNAIINIGSTNISLLDPAGTGLKNISGTAFNFTVTLNWTTDLNSTYTNVTIMFIDRKNFSTMFNRTLSNFSGVGCSGHAADGWNCSNRTYFNFSLNTATIPDGRYNISFFIINGTGVAEGGRITNVTASQNITVDNTAPNISNVKVGNLTNGINLSKNLTNAFSNFIITINITANDTTYIPDIFINLSNNSGYFKNISARRNVSDYNVSEQLNLSSLGDGFYHITVYANDSVGNRNGTQNFTFRIDRAPPTVTVTCGGPYTEGQTATCTCTATDTGGSLVQTGPRFSNGQSSESTTATGTAGTSSGCEAIDYAGNVRTAITGTWTVTAASSGGGGSGGSGGGSSSGVPAQFEKRVWTSINAGEIATVEVDNGAIGVTQVSFSVATTTYGAWVQVKKLDSLPSSVEAFDNTEYRALEITQRNVESALSGTATVKFKVEKDWLSDNSVTAANVALFRYVGSDWTALPTTMGEDDGTYVHYSAATPGFSYFVIGEAETTTAVAAAKETVPAEAVAVEEAAVEEEAAAPAAAVSAKSNAVVWVVPLVVLLLVAGLLYWYWQKR